MHCLVQPLFVAVDILCDWLVLTRSVYFSLYLAFHNMFWLNINWPLYMYKIKTNKMIIFYFFHFIFFWHIYFTLSYILKNKNTNKQTKSRTSSWPILAQTDRYYQCPKLNTFIVWTYFGCFRCCFVILYFVQFCFCLFCFCLFFRKNLFAAVDASPTPPPGGGADLKHGARRCEYLKTHFYVPKKD